jgi:hypothetical protein
MDISRRPLLTKLIVETILMEDVDIRRLAASLVYNISLSKLGTRDEDLTEWVVEIEGSVLYALTEEKDFEAALRNLVAMVRLLWCADKQVTELAHSMEFLKFIDQLKAHFNRKEIDVVVNDLKAILQ